MAATIVSLPSSILSKIERENDFMGDLSAHRCEVEDGENRSHIRKNNHKFMLRLMKERGIVK